MTEALTAKQQFWSEHLENAERFDGSLAEYARTQKLSPQTLYIQRNALKQRLAATASIAKEQTRKKVFTEVISHTDMPMPGATLYLGQAQLKFNRLPDPQWLAQLITASQSL